MSALPRQFTGTITINIHDRREIDGVTCEVAAFHRSRPALRKQLFLPLKGSQPFDDYEIRLRVKNGAPDNPNEIWVESCELGF